MRLARTFLWVRNSKERYAPRIYIVLSFVHIFIECIAFKSAALNGAVSLMIHTRRVTMEMTTTQLIHPGFVFDVSRHRLRI